MNRQTTTLVCSVLALAGPAWAEQVLREVSWAEAAASERWSEGVELVTADASHGFDVLRIENPTGKAKEWMILSMDKPAVTSRDYAVVGQVRYEHMEGDAYLEMLSTFEGPHTYFTRTLADSGLLKKLSGTSGWRPFALPFNVGQGKVEDLQSVTLRLIQPGRGTVELGPARLIQFEGSWQAALGESGWWTGRTAGWLGGIGGSLIGCLGALVGWLSAKGKGYRLASGLLKGGVVFGGVLILVGLVALIQSQPYAVYYPLLLLGGLLTVLSPIILLVLRNQQRQHELRRMEAMDAG
jgi:hypothetical protein